MAHISEDPDFQRVIDQLAGVDHDATPAEVIKHLTSPHPELVAKAAELGIVSVAWWGFDRDDSTRYLCDAIQSGATQIIVPSMQSPWVTKKTLILDRSGLTIHFQKGSVLQGHATDLHQDGDSRNSLVLIHKDGTDGGDPPSCIVLRGERVNADEWKARFHVIRRADEANYETSGSSCLLIGRADDSEVSDIVFNSESFDGIRIGNPGSPERLVLNRIVCDQSARNGVSVISVRELHVVDSKFVRTGTETRKSPYAGLDIEPKVAKDFARCIRIERCLFFANHARDIAINFECERDLKPGSKRPSGPAEPATIQIVNCVCRFDENPATRNPFEYVRDDLHGVAIGDFRDFDRILIANTLVQRFHCYGSAIVTEVTSTDPPNTTDDSIMRQSYLLLQVGITKPFGKSGTGGNTAFPNRLVTFVLNCQIAGGQVSVEPPRPAATLEKLVTVPCFENCPPLL